MAQPDALDAVRIGPIQDWKKSLANGVVCVSGNGK